LNRPAWKTDGANLTAAGLRALIGAAFDAGHKQGVEDERTAEKVGGSVVDKLLREMRNFP
jgi:hypothetical protein